MSCPHVRRLGEIHGLSTWSPHAISLQCCSLCLSSALGQDTARQFAMVDHADMRGLVTDWTSLHRGAGLSLVAGFIDRECPHWGLSRWPMPV